MRLYPQGILTLEAYRQDVCIGRLRYKWISFRTIHVMSLVTLHPSAIWILKRQLYALPWWQIMFRRRKLARQHHSQPWRSHRREYAYVA